MEFLEAIPENILEAIKSASTKGFLIHEESSGENSSFSFILPDTRIVSGAGIWQRVRRREALVSAVKAVIPYLDKFPDKIPAKFSAPGVAAGQPFKIEFSRFG